MKTTNYLHTCYLDHSVPSLDGFLRILENKLKVETKHAIEHDKRKGFSAKIKRIQVNNPQLDQILALTFFY